MNKIDQPERIWIEEDDCPYFYIESELAEVGSPVTEYVRSDLYAALKTDNTSLIHDLNRIKDHETELINDNAAKDARIKELERRLKEVELEHTGVRNSYFVERRKVIALEADNKRLRDALEPFADAADDLDDDDDDMYSIWECPAALSIYAGHLRAARAALKEISNAE